MARFFQTYVFARLFEWVMATAMLALGAEVFFWPQSIPASAFHYITQVVRPEHLSAFYLGVGGLRLVSLFINGRSPRWGPVVRSAGCVGAAVLWGEMAVALALQIPHSAPSPGIPIYLSMTLGELVGCYRAMTDMIDGHR